MFEEAFLQLTRADQDAFAKAINELLLNSFIVRDEFDRREKQLKLIRLIGLLNAITT